MGLNELDIVELKRTLGGLAELLMSYTKELQVQGFSRKEALQIVIAWQRALMMQPSSNTDNK